MSRDELRDDLRAMINAAPELGEEERDHLADVFLDRLEEGYRLVPRGQDLAEPARPAPRRAGFPIPFAWPLGLFALMAVVWLLASSLFFAAHHAPVFLFVILIFLALRFFVWGPRRRLYR
jgi:Flp pilus assembly protein TadB